MRGQREKTYPRGVMQGGDEIQDLWVFRASPAVAEITPAYTCLPLDVCTWQALLGSCLLRAMLERCNTEKHRAKVKGRKGV